MTAQNKTVPVPVGQLQSWANQLTDRPGVWIGNEMRALLPKPKPALPATPGSVVRVDVFFFLTHNGWVDEYGNKIVDGWIGSHDWQLVIDSNSRATA